MGSRGQGVAGGSAALPADVRQGLCELAEVCDRGLGSGWPSRDHWQNGEVWQNTYVALSTRILDGRVDVDRPLAALARLTAWRLLVSERRRQRRVTHLTDVQLHRFHMGEERTPEEEVESASRGEALQVALLTQLGQGNLSDVDLTVLIRRYVDEWEAAEVAAATGLSPANVRKICSRRCHLLREELVKLGIVPDPIAS